MSYIDKFKWNNPWIRDFRYNQESKSLTVNFSDNKFLVVWIDGSVGVGPTFEGYGWFQDTDVPRPKSTIPNYFKDFTRPTAQEKEMFHMLFGWEIPWSVDCPLVL